MQSCYRFLDLTTPLQIGGLPFLHNPFHSIKTTFVGCIADLYLDHQLIDLNRFLDSNGTEPGCKQKNNFCKDLPCFNGGTCEEGWNSFICHCKVGFSGKDCTKGEKSVKQFFEKGFLVYIPRLHPVQLPWLISISFRTRKTDGLLLQVQLGISSQIKLECLNGNLRYSFNNESLQIDSISFADGKWHNVDAVWTAGDIVLTFDYSQSQIRREFKGNIKGLYVGKISVGGLEPGNENKLQTHFEGCIKDVHVGSTGDSWINPVLQDNVKEGCIAPDICNSNPCPENSQCIDLWNNFSCHCNQGCIGLNCKPVCTVNPCLNGGTCVAVHIEKKVSNGYKCICSQLYSGKYCETFLNQSCPSMWWGHPICGPCNCDLEKGYDANCDKITGKCKCEENHYQLSHSDFCIPCKCYSVGSYNSRCNIHTGQCHCRPGVIGRQCDSCSNPFAEVTLRGCEVIYGGCPKAFSHGIWWERTSFNFTSIQQCPDDAVGTAERHCSPKGWEKPNVFDCTTIFIAPLQVKLTDIKEGRLVVNSSIINEISENLFSISELPNPLYGNDILLIFQLIHFLLHHELQQENKNASHFHNSNFIQNIVLGTSIILNPLYIHHWEQVSALTGRGPDELLNLLEKYMHVIIRKDETEMPHSFEIAAENIILGVDTIDAMMYLKNYEDSESVHFAALPFLDFSFQSPAIIVPKYNNYPNTMKSRGDTSKAILPLKVINPAVAKDNHKKRHKSCHLLKNCAVVSYAIYPTIGRLLPPFYDISIPQGNEIITEINSDVFTLIIQPAGEIAVHNLSLSENVIVRFQLLVPEGYENVQCVHWISYNSGRGGWSSDGCVMIDQKYEGRKSYVNCSCSHLSSFAVLMDVRTQTGLVAESQVQSAFSYFGILLSLLMLLSTFMIFCLLRGTETNSNIIHKNLVSSIFIADLVFLIALKTQGKHLHQEFTCKLMAILLHYFFLCEFCWTLVESIHLYRMLTQMQDINHGQMRPYYFVGYGIPAIIVGLAVGIHADQYGNDIFCWLSVHDSIVWSLVAPICILVVLILGMFGVSVHSTIDTKETVTDFGNVRTVLWIGIILLPILGATWILAVLCVNESIVALHYVFIMFCLIEGIYIFFGYCVVNKKVRQYLLDALTRLNNMGFLQAVNGITTTRQSAYHAPFKVLRRSVGISTCSNVSQSTAKTYSTPCKSESQCHQDMTLTPPVKLNNLIGNPVLRSASLSSNEATYSPPPPYESRKAKENENEAGDSSRKHSYAKSMPSSSCNSSKVSIPAIGAIGSYENENEAGDSSRKHSYAKSMPSSSCNSSKMSIPTIDITPASNSFADMTDFEIPPIKLPATLLSQNAANWAGISISSPSISEEFDEDVKKVASNTHLSPCEATNDLNNTVRIHEVGALLESRFSPPLIDDSPETSDSENPCSFYSITDNCANSKPIYNDLSNADRAVSTQCNTPNTLDEKTTPPSKSRFVSTYHAHLIPPLATAELSSDSD